MSNRPHFNIKSSFKICSKYLGATGFLLLAAYILTVATYAPQAKATITVIASAVVHLDVLSGISITPASSTANMSSWLGVSQNVAIATSSWVVATNDSLGYTLSVNATSSPAMQSGANIINNYQTGVPNGWSVASGQANFGYSAFGPDTPVGTWGAATTNCQAGATSTISTTLNYRGFTTSPYQIASRSSTTTPTGVTSTVCYAVQQNNFYIPSGSYNATIIATAVAL